MRCPAEALAHPRRAGRRRAVLRIAEGEEIACAVRHTPLGRCWGYMLRARLRPAEALLLVLPRPTVAGAGIHTRWVFCSLAVVWLAEDGTVVDAALARPWQRPRRPTAFARYILEGPPVLLRRVAVGQRVHVKFVNT